MVRALPTLLAVPVLLTAGGCCSLARWFCGPDLSEWVQIDFATPLSAVKTFMEAARRDDASVVFKRCLSEHYLNQLNVDSIGMAIAWQKMKQEAPLHMLGYAQIVDPRQDGDRAICTLDVSGYRLELRLVQQAGWLVEYLDDRGVVKNRGAWSLPPGTRIAGEGDASRLMMPPLVINDEGTRHPIPIERVTLAGLSHEWKIDGIKIVEPARSPEND